MEEKVKKKTTFWLPPDMIDRMDSWLKADNCRSRNEFVPHRLRLKMHRLFLSGQITPNSRKGAHRQDQIIVLPRWAKPSCGCCIT